METQDSYQETRYHIINRKQQEQSFHKNEKNRCINRMEDQKLKFGRENIPLSIFPQAAPIGKIISLVRFLLHLLVKYLFLIFT